MPEVSPRGTYLIIAEMLRSASQAEQVGHMPSEADLMGAHGVSRNTIRRALKVLEADEVVEPAPGIGWRAWSEGMTGGRWRSV
ncbi:GntR family transcriptional regulator [Streptomyces coelicoflavus]|uniref:GntR family transcriptional regulator n=1 Tax=Streptomyces coelicoflavus TaxID=285562 RepID=UPI0036AF940D